MTVEEYMRQVENLLETEFAAHNIYVQPSNESHDAQACYGTLGDICRVTVIVGHFIGGDEFMKVFADSCGAHCNKESVYRWPDIEELKSIIYACANFLQVAGEY